MLFVQLVYLSVLPSTLLFSLSEESNAWLQLAKRSRSSQSVPGSKQQISRFIFLQATKRSFCICSAVGICFARKHAFMPGASATLSVVKYLFASASLWILDVKSRLPSSFVSSRVSVSPGVSLITWISWENWKRKSWYAQSRDQAEREREKERNWLIYCVVQRNERNFGLPIMDQAKWRVELPTRWLLSTKV